MSEIRSILTLVTPEGGTSSNANAMRVGYVDGAIGGPEKAASLAALFPNIRFVSVGADWPDRPPAGLSALIVRAAASDAQRIIVRLGTKSPSLPVIVALSDADVPTTRSLMRAGASDILTVPVSEAALALSLERLLAKSQTSASSQSGGQVVGLLKAGGGTGATALGTQLTAILAGRAGDAGACFADLDLQFGAGAMYLDLSDAMTLTDILGSGGALEEAPLATAIARHRSGARVLAAPREMTPLETLSPSDIDGLIKALKRDFAITLMDLPTVWTAWTNEALQLCDRIVLITHLSVPHINLAKRQLRVMAAQGLDAIPLTLVCNQLSADQQSILSLKTAEKALGRAFDVAIPEDRKLMNDAIAQGCQISTLRSGSRLEKKIAELAAAIMPVAAVAPQKRTGLWS